MRVQPKIVVLLLSISLLAAACAGNELRSEVAERAARPTTTSTIRPASSTTTTTTTPVSEADPPSAASGFPPNWTPAPIDWKSCTKDKGAQCGDLAVPLDWSQPTGPQIRLAVGRYVHSGSGDRIGALFINPGGPGGSGLDFLFGSPFNKDVTTKFDLVSWDPRGVGQSTKIDCGADVTKFLDLDPDPDTPAEQSALDAGGSSALADCATKPAVNALLSHVGTDDTARDLEALRIALADKRLNYVGFSYGTYIGQRYLQLFPTHVRAMVMDGVVDPTLDLPGLLAGQTAAMTATLDRILATCTAKLGCGLANPQAAYDALKARVEQSPLPTADPAHTVGPAELAVATVSAMYQPEDWPVLLKALQSAMSGDGTGLWKLASQYYDAGDFAAYAAITCLDEAHPVGQAAYRTFVDQLRAQSPRLGGSVGNEMLPCATWPVPSQPHPELVSGEGSPDILVVGNTGDPATPYQWAQHVTQGLSKGHLLTYKGEGHTSYGRDACIDAMVNAYLVSLKVPPEGASCSGGGGSAGV